MNEEIMRFCRAFMRNKSVDLPVRPSQFAVLDIMCSVPGMLTPVELSRRLGVSKAMISMHLSALVDMGLVMRVQSPEDGRSVVVMPSRLGRDLFDRVVRASNKRIEILSKKMGKGQFDELLRLISVANQILDDGSAV